MNNSVQNDICKLFFEYHRDIFIIFSIQDTLQLGKLSEVNEAGCQRLGYDRKDLMAMTFEALIPEDKILHFMKNMQHLLEKKEILFETELLTQAKEILPVEILSTLVQNKDEKIALFVIREMSNRMRHEKAQNYRMELNWILTSISSRFINLVASEIDKGIFDALRILGKFVKADRSFVFIFSDDKDKMSNTHEWCEEGITPLKNIFQRLNTKDFPLFLQNLKKQRFFAMENIPYLPDTAKNEKQLFLQYDIKSLLVVPLVFNQELFGFIGFNTTSYEKHWSEDDIAILQFAGEIISNAFQRKKIEEALFISENKYRMLVENLQEGIMVINQNNEIVFVNRAMAIMIGFSQEEILNTSILHYINEKFVKATEYFLKRQQLGIKEQFDMELKRKDKSTLFAAIASSPIFNSDNQFEGSLCAVVDITDRKLTQQILTRRLKYEKCLAECSKSLLAHTQETNSIYPALKELLLTAGVSRVYIFENHEDEELGLCMSQKYEVVAEGIKPEINNPELQNVPYSHGCTRWEEKLSCGVPIKGIIRDFPKSEREILEPQSILSILVLPIFSKGKWYGFIGFDDTLTERIWNEDEILLLGTASEIIGSYIDNKTTENQMNFLFKNLEYSLKNSESKFTIQNEIFSLLFNDYNEMVSHILESPKSSGLENAIKEKTFSLFSDVLALKSFIEKYDLEYTVIHPQSWLELYLSFYQVLLDKNHIEIEIESHITQSTAIRSQHFYSAALFLMSTLIHISYQGKIIINSLLEENYLQMQLSISGVSMKKAEIKGIESKIKTLFHENISVHSTGENEICFVLFSPLIALSDSEEMKHPSHKTQHSAQKIIYFAEDDSTFFRLLEKILSENNDYKVKGFPNGVLLMNHLSENPVCDLIILDIQMPLLDGIETLKQIKSINKNIPVIALSAFTPQENIGKYSQEDFQEYITKPINKPHFLNTLKRILGM